MTDEQVATQAIANRVKAYSDQAASQLTMTYGQVGRAKGPQDAAAMADGRATIAAKCGEDKLAAAETALKALSDWATTALKA